jgi:hypothetical protein
VLRPSPTYRRVGSGGDDGTNRDGTDCHERRQRRRVHRHRFIAYGTTTRQHPLKRPAVQITDNSPYSARWRIDAPIQLSTNQSRVGSTQRRASIVLESDGKETVPNDPDAAGGEFTAARAAKDQGVKISTISFGTLDGTVDIDGMNVPVPVDDASLQKVADTTGGQAYRAGTLGQLEDAYTSLQQQIGYETTHGDASASWIRLGAIVMAAALVAGLLLNRRLPD